LIVGWSLLPATSSGCANALGLKKNTDTDIAAITTGQIGRTADDAERRFDTIAAS
jgi:hypothetical protein